MEIAEADDTLIIDNVLQIKAHFHANICITLFKVYILYSAEAGQWLKGEKS